MSSSTKGAMLWQRTRLPHEVHDYSADEQAKPFTLTIGQKPAVAADRQGSS
jgi:hypothetical protein